MFKSAYFFLSESSFLEEEETSLSSSSSFFGEDDQGLWPKKSNSIWCKFCYFMKEPGGRGGEFCYKHCCIEGHGHCTNFGCGNDSHGEGNKCQSHCIIQAHKHCIKLGCSKKTIYGSFCSDHKKIFSLPFKER